MKKISNSRANLLEMIDKIISEVNNKKLYSVTTDDIFYPYVYSDAVNKIIQHLYDGDFILKDFNWVKSQDEAAKYFYGRLSIENANTELCCQLLTTIIRKERFCSGVLAGSLNNGHFIGLLKQLIKLQKE